MKRQAQSFLFEAVTPNRPTCPLHVWHTCGLRNRHFSGVVRSIYSPRACQRTAERELQGPYISLSRFNCFLAQGRVFATSIRLVRRRERPSPAVQALADLAVPLHQTGYSSIAKHFQRMKVGSVDFSAVRRARDTSRFAKEASAKEGGEPTFAAPCTKVGCAVEDELRLSAPRSIEAFMPMSVVDTLRPSFARSC